MELWLGIAVTVLTLIASLACGCYLLFYHFPHIMVKLMFRLQAHLAGMRIRYVTNEGNTFCYGERNRRQNDKMSIVLIHGFTSSKDQWISCFQQLPKDIHIVALDLPGHGGSSAPQDDEDINFERGIDTVHEFLDLVGLSEGRIHMVGSSMGGAVVGMFAAKYPHKVDRISLVCPAVETPVDTQLQLQIKNLDSLDPENISHKDVMFLCNNVPDLRSMLQSLCYNKDLMNLHHQILKGILVLRLPRLPYFMKLVQSLRTFNKLDTLNRAAHTITVPSQLIWGLDDELIHVSGADMLKSKLVDCRHVDIVEKCGHALHVDRPGSLTKHIVKFYTEGIDKKEN